MKTLLLAAAGIALACGLPPALAWAESDDPATAQQTSQLNSASWINCASQGDHCYPDDSVDVVTMRYGEGANYTYIITQGLNRIACNNFWGNPADGKDKQCAFTTTNILDVAPSDSFSTVANEGETFTLPDTGLVYWVRYGLDDAWMYTLMSGDGVSQMACTNDYFSYNPLDGPDKICQYSQSTPYSLSDGSTLAECATEGQNCDLQSTDVVLMRYGANNAYNWRFLHAGDPVYPCDNDTFAPDPVQVSKRCYWMPVSPSALSTIGYWQQVQSCLDPGCTISQEITVGTRRTNTWSTSATWSATVTLSIEDSFSVLGTGEKVSESVASTFAASEAFQSSVSLSETESRTATCSSESVQSSLIMYQFNTGTQENCLQDVNCSGATATTDYACIPDPPSGYQGPQCVPGFCTPGDTLCQLPCAE